MFEIEGFGEIVVGAELDALNRNGQVVDCGQHDDPRFDLPFLQLLKHLYAAHARHPDIQQNEILRRARHHLDGGVAIICYLDVVAFAGQLVSDEETECFFVVDVEDVLWRFRAGHLS